MKQIDLDNGYVMMSEDSDFDPASILEGKDLEAIDIVPNKSIDIILTKGQETYKGTLEKFILSENKEGKKLIKVVFELKE